MDFSVVNLLYRKLQSLAKVFRFVELCILLAILSWLSSHLPFAVKISGEYFRKLISLILSPISIFLIGNAIVVTLLAKSGLFTAESSSMIDNAVTELYEDLRSGNVDDFSVSLKEEEQEIVFEDKEIISEENLKSPIVSDEAKMEVKAGYRRSQSEKFWSESKMEEKLRRSETEICRKSLVDGEKTLMEEVFPADKMSDEEFNKTIEAFIAKQVKFHQNEQESVVLHTTQA